MNDFENLAHGPLNACGLKMMQVNVGLKCNLRCLHCHLSAGPNRGETMDRATMAKVVDAARQAKPGLVDITGGAPELCQDLPWLLTELSRAGLKLQVRSNLAVLLDPGLEHYFDLYPGLNIDLAVSLPCYLEENVARMRGPGVFPKIIEAMRRLNAKGYARQGGPRLDLVFNHPLGPYLPPCQQALENDYRAELTGKHGVAFSSLLTITNMPLGRYLDELRTNGQEEDYWALLRNGFNPANLEGLMCRRQISVDWNGRLYDCDFNLALGLPVNHGAPDHIDRFDLEALSGRAIVTGPHCLGCAAGAGSSCKGALS
jgi:radical SAM/Cys-rich protein